MKIKYTQNEEIYVLSNFSTATNPLFRDLNDLAFFIKKLDQYLKPICLISGHGFNDDQFQILVRLKSRATFEEFHIKHKKQKKDGFVPESTYILSQEVANLESTYAMYFNRKYKRIGAVFARRFQKIWVRTESEFEYWLDRINNLVRMHIYIGRWKCREKIGGFVSSWYRSSKYYYENMHLDEDGIRGKKMLFSEFVLGTKPQLQAWFSKSSEKP